MNVNQLINKITEAISFQFKEDKTVPGLQIAALKNGYYTSIVRYSKPFGKEKAVVCSATGDTLESTLFSLAESFVLKVKSRNPIQELHDLIKK